MTSYQPEVFFVCTRITTLLNLVNVWMQVVKLFGFYVKELELSHVHEQLFDNRRMVNNKLYVWLITDTLHTLL